MKSLLLFFPVALLAGCTVTLSDNIASGYESIELPGQQLEYRVYLPPQYEIQPDREFPLLVYFHGGGGDHRTWGARRGLGERLIKRMESEEFGPFVVLAPSVGKFDVIAGESERVLFEQVIPDVRREYRVNNTTVAFGHSMGGLSAMMLGLRNPYAFDAVAAASPFAFDVSPFEPQSEIDAFKSKHGRSPFVNRWLNSVAGKFSTKQEFDAHSPFMQIRKFDGRLPFELFLTTGTEDYMGLYAQNQLLHEALESRGIEHEFLVQDGVSHSTIAEPRLYMWIDEQAGRGGLARAAAGN